MNQKHIYFQIGLAKYYKYFAIDENNRIRFDMPATETDAFRYHEISVILSCNKDFEINLYNDFLIAALRDLSGSIELCLNGGAVLHPSITKDIGYLWNEYLHDVELPIETDSEGYSFWVGRKYLVWDSAKSKAASWLYEKDGKFWLEVTPGYPWHFPDSAEDEALISYEEFMKTYKPIALFEVSRETLEKWLKRVDELIPVVEANDDKYFIKQK